MRKEDSRKFYRIKEDVRPFVYEPDGSYTEGQPIYIPGLEAAGTVSTIGGHMMEVRLSDGRRVKLQGKGRA